MRERQCLADILRPGRHAGKRKQETGQQNIRQKKHHRHLHRLQLVLRHGRERVADRQIGGDEQRAERGEHTEIADDRHTEQRDADADDQRGLHETDHDIGRDLAEHDLDGGDRHRQQAFHGAALDLACHRQRSKDQHGHGEDGADQSGHDVELGHAGRIVARVGADFERHDRTVGNVAVVRQRGLQHLAERAERRTRRHRIGSVGCDQDRRLVAAAHRALEIGRYFDREQHGSRGEQLVDLSLGARQLGDLEIIGVP